MSDEKVCTGYNQTLDERDGEDEEEFQSQCQCQMHLETATLPCRNNLQWFSYTVGFVYLVETVVVFAIEHMLLEWGNFLFYCQKLKGSSSVGKRRSKDAFNPYKANILRLLPSFMLLLFLFSLSARSMSYWRPRLACYRWGLIWGSLRSQLNI
jgi:hypothetical protein